ncbi:MAG TPA: mechanosensitive ion channel family protein [Gemmatimonadaceae bacterium]
MDSAESWNTVHEMLQQFSASLPRLIFAIAVALFFYFLSYVVKLIVRRTTSRDVSHRTLRIAMGRIAQGIILIVGALVAVTAAFPGFTPANLVSALGIGGIAIGFAFKDIFENFLAGILILFSRPFRIGDQIIYDRYEGTVEEIQTRATWLKTYDGRRILIPNSELFKNSVTVNTAFDTRRLEYDFKIAADQDVNRAKQIIVNVMRKSEDVLPDPKADVIVISFDAGTVTIRARWWSKSKTSDVLRAQDRVLTAARNALAESAIKLPSAAAPTVVVRSDGSVVNQAAAPATNAVSSEPKPALAKDQ